MSSALKILLITQTGIENAFPQHDYLKRQGTQRLRTQRTRLHCKDGKLFKDNKMHFLFCSNVI